MRDPLKERFEAGKKVELDPRSTAIYEERMRTVLPEIAQNLRANQQRVAEMRASNKSRRRQGEEAGRR